MWMLGMNARSSTRAKSGFSHWTIISPVLLGLLEICRTAVYKPGVSIWEDKPQSSQVVHELLWDRISPYRGRAQRLAPQCLQSEVLVYSAGIYYESNITSQNFSFSLFNSHNLLFCEYIYVFVCCWDTVSLNSFGWYKTSHVYQTGLELRVRGEHHHASECSLFSLACARGTWS